MKASSIIGITRTIVYSLLGVRAKRALIINPQRFVIEIIRRPDELIWCVAVLEPIIQKDGNSK